MPDGAVVDGAVVDNPPLAPWEPDEAEHGPLLPLELLAWDGTGRLVGIRCSDSEVVLRSGRPAGRRPLTVGRLTRWARAGRVTLHSGAGEAGEAGGAGGPGGAGDVEVRLLAPQEYGGLSIGDERPARVAGPLRIARSGQRSAQREDVAQTLVGRVLRVFPDAQVFTG